MAIDLATLLAGLTGGAQGMGQAVVQEDQRKRQNALDAETRQLHAAQMANLASDAENRRQQRYLQGFRDGTAPDQQGLLTALNVGGAMTPSVGAAPSGAAVAIQQAIQSDPRFTTDRYSQVSPTSYVDQTQTPEAVQQRRVQHAAQVTQQQADAERQRKIAAMIGTKLPNGQVIDEHLANAMIASPQLGASFVRPPEQPKPDHYQVSNAVDANGHPIVINTLTGEEHSSTGQRPVSTATNAETQKEQKRVELMAQGYRLMEQYNGKVRPNVVALAINSPTAGNLLLSPDEQQYMLGLRNFIAGEMHAESGARLSKEQLAFGFQRYGPQIGDKNISGSKLAEAKRALEGSQRAFQGAPAPDVRNDAPDPLFEKYNLTPRGH